MTGSFVFVCQDSIVIKESKIKKKEGEIMKIAINNSQKGFTLIEILVVLFLCSLVILPGLYSWQQQLQRHHLIDTARQVSEFIYSNLMEGIYLNQHRILSINQGRGNWSLVVKDAVTQRERNKLTAEMFKGIEINKVTRTSVDLYGKQGTSRAFSISLTNKNEQITIVMSAVGRIRGCSSQLLAGIPRC